MVHPIDILLLVFAFVGAMYWLYFICTVLMRIVAFEEAIIDHDITYNQPNKFTPRLVK